MAKKKKKNTAHIANPQSQNGPIVEDEPKSYNWIDGVFGYLPYRVIIICFALLLVILTVGLFLTGREDRWQRAAEKAFQNQDWPTSIKFYEKRLTLADSDDVASAPLIDIHLNLARCFLELGQTKEAAKILDAMAQFYKVHDKKAKKTAAEFFSFQAWRYIQQNEIDRVEVNLSIALGIDRNNSLSHALSLQLALEKNRYDKASKHYQFIMDNPRYSKQTDAYLRIMQDEFLQIPDAELSDVPQRAS